MSINSSRPRVYLALPPKVSKTPMNDHKMVIIIDLARKQPFISLFDQIHEILEIYMLLR